MKKIWIVLALLVVATFNQLPVAAEAGHAKSPAGWGSLPGCVTTTYSKSLGTACAWAYWGFLFEDYNSTASGGAKAVSASSITVAPTFYPGVDPNFYGVTFTSPEWKVGKGQVKTVELVVWVNSLPTFNAAPLYFLNGLDDNLSETTNDASWSRGKVHHTTIWASVFLVVLQQLRDPIGSSATFQAFAIWVQIHARLLHI